MITAIRLQNPTADSSPVETDSIFSPPFSFIPEPELLPVLLSFPESGFSGFAGVSGFAGFSGFADSPSFSNFATKRVSFSTQKRYCVSCEINLSFSYQPTNW